MYSSIVDFMDEKTYLYTSIADSEAFSILDDEFGESSYGREKYTPDEMFWIGYIYRCISIRFNLPSKSVYKLFNARKIVRYYNICHTFDVVDVAERMMDSISYKEIPIEERAYEAMKRLLLSQKEQ